jgi:GntR family transcriptional regulator
MFSSSARRRESEVSDLESASSMPYVTPHPGDAWAADAAARGKTGTHRLLAVDIIEPSPQVRDALSLRPGDRVVVRRRLVLLDDTPVELADSYYPATIAEATALAGTAKIRGGAVTLLAQLGHAPAEIIEEITARMSDEQEALMLALHRPEPLIVLGRLSRDADGTPVEYAVNRMVAGMTPPLTFKSRVPAE